MIKDNYNRKIDYMRISITDRCNLRCRYCMPEDIAFVPHDEILRYEEFLRLVRIFARQGIRKIKVTGGEPLVRTGCAGFMKELKAVEGIDNVTITTNGVLLEKYLPDLIDAGVDGINVSLDSLNRDRFAHITGRDEFDRVWESIESAVAAGLKVKLNCVPLREYNADEIPDFFELARTRRIDVRFIEMMPIGYGKRFQPVSTQEILQELKERYDGIYEIREKRGNGPATYYENRDFVGCVGFIGAVHEKFCDTCNRIRLTSEGFLKLCLFYSQGIDLRAMLRGGAGDEEIARAIAEAVRKKPQEHQFACETVPMENASCDGRSQNTSPNGMDETGKNTFSGGMDETGKNMSPNGMDETEEDMRSMSQIGG